MEWAFIAAVIIVGIYAVNDYPLLLGLAVVLVFVGCLTFALPYLLALFVFVGQLVQEPVEMTLINRAKATLAKHKGFKIAIAGSYGKTSMREILRTVLSEGKKVAAPGGSENTPIGIARFVNRLKGDEEVLVFELGEYYPGDIKLLAEMVRPDLGVITGVNEAHLSKFKTVDAATATIFELAAFVEPEHLYVNAENEAARLQSSKETTHYSRERVADWSVIAAETSLDGTSFNLERKGERMDVQSKLVGLHNVGPLAAAAHVALSLGLNTQQIEKGLAQTKPFAHRLERRDDPNGVITLDDSYNGNPDGVKAVIDFLASISGKRRWYVTPGLVEMGEKSEEIHKNIGKQLAEAGIEKVVLIKNSVTPWIEKGLQENSLGGDIVWFDDALNCYNSLPHITVTGDVVVLQNDWPDQYA